MIIVDPYRDTTCPYRDILRVNTASGCVSWYQLLGVNASSSSAETMRRFEERRRVILRKQQRSDDAEWDRVLDELDQALMCLSSSRKRAEYDAELCTFRQQTVQHVSDSQPNTETVAPAVTQAASTAVPTIASSTANAAFNSPLSRAPERRDEVRSSGSSHREPIAAEPVPKRAADVHSAPSQATPVRTPASPVVPTEPLELIGRGHYGTRVYAAYDTELNRTVAVKSLNKAARSKSRRQQFLEEARFLASVSHPHLVEVHGIDNRRASFTMEFLPQPVTSVMGSLRSQQRTRQVTEFLRAGLSVLQCLHERQVVHGGIRLHSFRLADTRTIKLTDAPGCTTSGFFRAPTPQQTCLAPELLSPESFGKPGAAVDLYMLGFAAIELLAGNDLSKWFRKVGDQAQWLRWHGSPFEQLPSLEEFVPDLPSNLSAVIERLCRKQVSERYHSAQDALNDLAPITETRDSVTTSQAGAADRSSDEAVTNLGGAPPLLVESADDTVPAPDLIEILQDPALLWKSIRRSRTAQLAIGMTFSLFIVVWLLPSGTAVEVDPSARSIGQPPVASVPAPPSEPEIQASEPLLPFDDDLPTVRLDEPVAAPVAAPPAVPVVFDSPKPVDLPKPVVPRKPVVQLIRSPSAFEFSATGLETEEDRQRFKRALVNLERARTSRERQALLRVAEQLAPDDPRPPFIYAATFGFIEVRQWLEDSVYRSDARFTQAFRVSVENILRGPRDAEDIADKTFARISRFRDLLQDPPVSEQAQYDWQWIGRVIGYCERSATDNQVVRSMIVTNLDLIQKKSSPAAWEHVLCGRDAIQVQQVFGETADVYFPRQPKTEISLCLETIE